MYRTVVKQEPMKDAFKSQTEVTEDLFNHAIHKSDISRNMLSTLYVRDPYNFNEKADEVKKVLSSGISWPKGYIPEEHPIFKPKVKKTKEEKMRDDLREKHRIQLDPLNKYYLEETITNLTKVANTENAYQTYKV